jgi:hypothetical protein
MGSRRAPPPSLNRRAPAQVRSFRLTIWGFVEGANTECEWLDYLKQRSCELSIQVTVNDYGCVPKTIAQRSIAKRKSLDRDKHSSDEVWAVFDRDTHPHLRESIADCQAAGVGVAYSNACFERWPLLFIEDCTHGYTNKQLQDRLHDLHPYYHHDDGAHVDWPKLQPNLDLATARALKLHKTATRHMQNGEELLSLPFTTAWMLHHRLLRGDAFVSWLAETLRPTPALHELVTYLPTPLRAQVLHHLSPATPTPAPNQAQTRRWPRPPPPRRAPADTDR